MRRAGYRPSNPFTSKPQHGSPGLHEKRASGSSSTCPRLARMPDPPHPTSPAAGKGKKVFARLFPPRLIRPSVMFGRGDAFVIPIARMLRRFPVFPLFRRGQTQLQPAYVEDVADAIARVMQNTQSPMCYELGGPRVYAYRSLLEVIVRHRGIKPLLISIPFGLWHALASVAEMLPEPPITRNQVELMQLDNVASPGAPGFGDLGISSTSLEDALPAIVGL